MQKKEHQQEMLNSLGSKKLYTMKQAQQREKLGSTHEVVIRKKLKKQAYFSQTEKEIKEHKKEHVVALNPEMELDEAKALIRNALHSLEL